MADDPSKRGTPDNDLISMSQEHEVRYWCNKWGITKQQLQAAVNAVGNSVRKVKAHLGK